MKTTLTALALTTALVLPGLAMARPVTFTTTLNTYGGDGAYARAAAWIAGADRWPEATWADLEAQLGVPSGMDSPAGLIGRPDPGPQGKRRSDWLGRREGWF